MNCLSHTSSSTWIAGGALAASTMVVALFHMRNRIIAQKSMLLAQKTRTFDQDNIVSVKLMDVEVGLHNRNEPPVTTLTWFRGDYHQARDHLKQRLHQILDQNPWLGGRVDKTRDGLFLEYDSSQQLNADDYIEVVDSNMSPISRSTPLDQLGKKCSNFFLVNGPIEPLIKITLVPCWTDPESHFALVVAVSHLIADGHTFYQLHHMLCGSDIVPLKVKRIEASASQQAAAMGTQNYSYFALPGLGFIVNSIFGFWRGKTIGPPNQTVFALVDKERMTAEKERVCANHKGVSFVSTNDVLTSWFLQKSGCSLGVMSINWRNRLTGHTDQHAGNYESGIFYRPSDSVSAALIRLSLLQGFERTKTFAQALPGFFEMVSTTTMAIVTNWAPSRKSRI